MRKALPVALTVLVSSLGASLAEPPDAAPTVNTTLTGLDSPSQQTVAGLTEVVGGERSHSCRTNALAGAVLATAGLALGSRWLSVIGGHLILLSETVCY